MDLYYHLIFLVHILRRNRTGNMSKKHHRFEIFADDTALVSDFITSMRIILNRVDTADKEANLKVKALENKIV